jgi:hypothetical protein
VSAEPRRRLEEIDVVPPRDQPRGGEPGYARADDGDFAAALQR